VQRSVQCVADPPAARKLGHDLVVTATSTSKSTVVGRLLADTGSLPDGKLEAVRAHCARHAKPFEYAFLLDALQDERAQGITIDAARVFFRTSRRDYILIDAPGHAEFLRNMVTGAARAEAALLVIDAREGVQGNSRRHGYLLSMLGIRQIAVLVNKMDLVGWSRDVFDRVADEYRAFLAQLQVEPSSFLPVSGATGENIASRSQVLAWYRGPTVLEALDGFSSAPPPVDAPFRMPVQGVYKFTGNGDERRIVAGTIQTGRLRVGDDIVFIPSGKKSRVRTIEGFNRPTQTTAERQATGVTLEDHIYVERGEMAVPTGAEGPHVHAVSCERVVAGTRAATTTRDCLRSLARARRAAGTDPPRARRLEPGRCRGCARVSRTTWPTARSDRAPLAFDTAERWATSRFVLVDRYRSPAGHHPRIVAGRAGMGARQGDATRAPMGAASFGPRRGATGRSPRCAITGPEGRTGHWPRPSGRCSAGRAVYFLGIANVLRRDADIETHGCHAAEHLRRLGEVTNLLLDAGLVVIATAVALTRADVDVLRTAIGPDRVLMAWLGEGAAELPCDEACPATEQVAEGVARLERLLRRRRVIFTSE
jgi:bifunctional enzyme CysN/CysC